MAAYNKDKRQKIVDEEAKSSILSTIGSGSFKAVDPLGNKSQLPSSISMIRSLIWIIKKLSGIVSNWLDDYQKKYDKMVVLRYYLDAAILELKIYSEAQDWDNTDVCKTYDDLKESIWDTDDTDDWTDDDLEFKENVKVGDDAIQNVSQDCQNRNAQADKEGEALRKWIVSMRVKKRGEIVDRVNLLRKAIRELKILEWSEIDLSKQFSTKMGHYLPFPDKFISTMEDALSKDKCSDVPTFHSTGERKALANKVKDKADYEAWKKYMPRMVVVKFLVALGFTDDLRSEIKDTNNPPRTKKVEKPSFGSVDLNGNQSLANDAYWADYVKSLSGVPAIKKAESSLLTAMADSATDALKGTIDYDNIMGFKENFTWSEGKKGGILFGYKGNTYELQGQQIGEVETIEPKIKSISENSGDIDEWDKKRLVEFMAHLRYELGKI